MKRFEFLISIPGLGRIRHLVKEANEDRAKNRINRAYPGRIPHFLETRVLEVNSISQSSSPTVIPS